MELHLSDFPDYVADGKAFLSARHHFFVNGVGRYDLCRSKRLSSLKNTIDCFEAGLDACIIYPASGDADTQKVLRDNETIMKTRNQYIFTGPSDELVRLCDTLSDENLFTIKISVVFKLKRNRVDWESLFSILYDPGFLENAGSVCSPSAYKYSRRVADDEHVYFILYAIAYAFPSFLVFGKSAEKDLFSEYAVSHCKISERFRNLYSH